MATHDVPGANPKNVDYLHDRCWAEHTDGSLVLVDGVESGRVIYQMFNLSHKPYPLRYMHAMPEAGFKTLFSVPPTGTSKIPWTWHDKTTFPWDRVMKIFTDPQPEPVDAATTISAAEAVAQDLGLKAQNLRHADIAHHQERETRVHQMIDKLASALKEVLG